MHEGGLYVSPAKVLIVDDEPEIKELINLYLTREGYEVLSAGSAATAVNATRDNNPDLIILDILLPDQNGIDTCQELRELTKAPILFVSCKDEDQDKIQGLQAGGDDYITKPFSPGELVARVNAHLRRNKLLRILQPERSPIQFPGLRIDASCYSVTVDDAEIMLTSKEFELLELLARHPNQVFTPERLFDLIWHENSLGDYRTVVVHISNLRRKIEPDPSNPKYVLTVRGAGYKFASL